MIIIESDGSTNGRITLNGMEERKKYLLERTMDGINAYYLFRRFI